MSEHRIAKVRQCKHCGWHEKSTAEQMKNHAAFCRKYGRARISDILVPHDENPSYLIDPNKWFFTRKSASLTKKDISEAAAAIRRFRAES